MSPATRKITRETGLSLKEIAAATDRSVFTIHAVVNGKRESKTLSQKIAALKAKR